HARFVERMQRVNLKQLPASIEKTNIQRRWRVSHPEAHALRSIVNEKHSVIRTQIASFHQAALHLVVQNGDLDVHWLIADLDLEIICDAFAIGIPSTRFMAVTAR